MPVYIVYLSWDQRAIPRFMVVARVLSINHWSIPRRRLRLLVVWCGYYFCQNENNTHGETSMFHVLPHHKLIILRETSRS